MMIEDLAAVLVTAGVGVLGTTLFLQIMPDTPDECLSVIEYGGRMGTYRMAGSPNRAVVTYPSVQISSRSGDPVAARTTIEAAYQALDGFSGTVGGTQFGRIVANQPPFFVHRDENERAVMTFNVSLTETH